MFLTAEELKTVAYAYQIEDIIEGDNTIVPIAIEASVEEMRSYLRSRFDVTAVFSAIGEERNALILELCKDIALWQLVRLSNPDIIFERGKDRYDRAIEFLNKVAKGLISPTLPLIQDESGEETSPVKYGSMEKQQYDW